MCLMRSYSFGSMYGVHELPTEVLELFTDLVDNPDKKIEFASEIISAGLQGRINFNAKFNLDAYEATIRKNQLLGKESRKKKECFLDYSDNSDDFEEVIKSGGISEAVATTKAVNKMEDAFEQILADDELNFAIKTIKSLQPILLVQANLDILLTIKQALKGVPNSIKLLQDVCEQYEVVAEQIKVILGSGRAFEEIFA